MRNILNETAIKDYMMNDLVQMITCFNEDTLKYCDSHGINIYDFMDKVYD